MTALRMIDLRPTARSVCVLALMAVLCLGAPPVLAATEIQRVETVGRAVATGVASAAELRRRALEDALYEAAMVGGADVQGYSAVSGSALAAERLVVRPTSRILDYTILSETRQGDVLEVKVRAHVGALEPQRDCGQGTALDIAAWTPQVTIAPDAPAWLQPVGHDAARALVTALGQSENVTVQIMGTPVPSTTRRLDPAFDYAALTGSAQPRTAPPTYMSFESVIEIGLLRQGNGILQLVASSQLVRPDGSVAATDRSVAQVALPTRTPWAMLNRIGNGDRQSMAAQLLRNLPSHARTVVRAEACRPLVGRLARNENGTYTLPYGIRHGITRQHLAYTDGAETPYTLFEVVDLADQQVSLRPIDRGRDPAALIGATARFAEPAQ